MIRVLSPILLLFAVGCNLSPKSTEQDVIKEVFGQVSNFELMRSTTDVSACRLTQPDHEHTLELAKYEERPWVQVPVKTVERFHQVFSSPSTYNFGIAKSCFPIYGVRVRFKTDEGTVDVNLCFDCDILTVVRDGVPVGGEDFDNARSELVALCKEIFPEDSEIQGLKSGRR